MVGVVSSLIVLATLLWLAPFLADTPEVSLVDYYYSQPYCVNFIIVEILNETGRCERNESPPETIILPS